MQNVRKSSSLVRSRPHLHLLTRAWVLAASAVLGCSENSPTRPDYSGPISDVPLVASVAARPGIPQSLVYVSLRPGTVTDAAQMMVRVLRTGRSSAVQVINGGFDPVSLPANVGDRVAIERGGPGNADPSPYLIIVPDAAPPIVLRTTPVSLATGVSMQPGLSVFFNEPVNIATLTLGSLRLREGNSDLPGSVSAIPSTSTGVRFTPDQPLAPGKEYELIVTDAVRDLDGLAIGSDHVVRFSTWTGGMTFSEQPVQPNPGSGILDRIQVTAQYASGAVASDYKGVVTLALAANTSGATLLGPKTVRANMGVATFENLYLDAIGSGYTLVAMAPGLAAVTSAPFDVTGKLEISGAVTSSYPGVTMPDIVIIATGLTGTPITDFSGPITISTAPGGAGTLLGTTTVTAIAGISVFRELRLDALTSTFAFVASAPGFPAALSPAIGVLPLRLGFVEPAATAFIGSPIAPAVRVAVMNLAGQTITGYNGDVTVTLIGNANGTLSGTRTVSVTNGVATFDNLRIDAPGSGYALRATSRCCVLQSATAPFDVVSTRLAFLTQPSQVSVGEPIAPSIQVAATNSAGETLTGFTGTISLALSRRGTRVSQFNVLTAPASNGIATFADVRIPNGGTDYTLIASAAGMAGSVSDLFAVIAPWMPQASMPTQRANFGSAVLNGRLYAVGGLGSGGTPIGIVEAYDPATNSWATRAPMLSARIGVRLGVVNGTMYALGGWNGSGYSTALEAYDPATNAWTARKAMPTMQGGMSIGIVNGILFAVGGGAGNGIATGLVRSYDPVTDEWTTMAPMPTARYEPGVAVINGVLYAIGGYVDNYDYSVETVEAYNPATNQWTTKASMPNYRDGPSAEVLGGRIYVIGGWNSLVDVYDPISNSWVAGAQMESARGLGATGVIAGVIYYVGGYVGGVPGVNSEMVSHHP